MLLQIKVDNIKCNGCVGSIKKGLLSFPEVTSVSVDKETETVEVDYQEGFDTGKIKDKLLSMGYPEKGTAQGINKLTASARSYVSCAIGKISDSN